MNLVPTVTVVNSQVVATHFVQRDSPAPVFSLCHATDRLPKGWMAAAEDWLKKCDDPSRVEYVLVFDDDGHTARTRSPGQATEAPSWSPMQFPFGRATVAPNRERKCAVDAWNESAKYANGKFLITVSDDWFPPRHWDTEMLKVIPDLDGEYVLDVDNQDGSYPLLPFSLLTRAYYKRLGYLFYPEYFGNMADQEFTDVARRDGVVIDARHLQFEHIDPERGGTWDAVYEKQRKGPYREIGMQIYERRKREGFPQLVTA